MPNQVITVHGYSASSDSLKGMAQFLKDHDFDTVPVWLGDYVSLDDDVRIEDATQRMNEVIEEKLASGELRAPFDMIVHSTGGLVARHWLASYNEPGNARLRRLVMLAPANFGSRLAHVGRSVLGRISLGLKNWGQTGTRMLNGLELGSDFQWDLARRDVVAEDEADAAAFYGCADGQTMPFVIGGAMVYQFPAPGFVNEYGSDGTVRPCAANVDAVGMTIDMTGLARPDGRAVVRDWTRRSDIDFAFAIMPNENHFTVAQPGKVAKENAPPFEVTTEALVLEALRCPDEATYKDIAGKWSAITAQTNALADDAADRSQAFGEDLDPRFFHAYLQTVVRVEDQYGNPVDDYAFEFFGHAPDDKGLLGGWNWSDQAKTFNGKVIRHVHANKRAAHVRNFFLDATELMRFLGSITDPDERRINAVLVAEAPAGSNISYIQDRSTKIDGLTMSAPANNVVDNFTVGRASINLYDANDPTPRFRPNRTHLIKVIVPRLPVDEVFRLTEYG